MTTPMGEQCGQAPSTDSVGSSQSSEGPSVRTILGYVALAALGVGVGYALRGAGEAQRGSAELIRAPGELRRSWRSARSDDELTEEEQAIVEEYGEED